MKVCSKCGVQKPLEGFHKKKRNKDGYKYHCKVCTREERKREYLKKKIKPKKAIEKKECSKCMQIKSVNYFHKNCGSKDGFNACCKTCVSALTKTLDHKKSYQRRKAWFSEYYKKNKVKINQKQKRYNAMSTTKKKANEREKKKYTYNISYRMRKNLRRRLNRALHGKRKCASTTKLLGCDIMYFKMWIESQFTKDMNWNNYGINGWHLDHMNALDNFDLNELQNQYKCSHYTNIQPLWGKENISKGSKIIYDMRWNGQQWEINRSGIYEPRDKSINK